MGASILIIEGDNLLQQHLARHFEIKNWRMFNAMKTKDIKRMFKKHGIDVVLLSLNDLKKEGLVLIRMIKKMRPPVQIITVNSPDQISLSIEGMKLGAFDDFLMPLDLDSLILRIRDACQAKKNIEIIKPSLLQRCQDLMVAASFAEAGDTETARELLVKAPKNASQTAGQKKGD
ncbi:MAG: response regulator [Desulfobacterales bacterium]|jgi:DNA-binding NtrC family response regulator|nr:response regulator [Desulfobacterales bacterium]